VIFAAHPWNGVPYGLHHIARALARLGWHVLYIEPYFSPIHLAGGRRRGRVLGHRPRQTDEPGVVVLSPFTLIPHTNLPFLRSRFTFRLSQYLSWPFLCGKSRRRAPFTQPDLVLCGSPAAIDTALSLGAKLTIYRLADDSSLFDVLTPIARNSEANAISRFDCVIVTSDALAKRAHQLNARRVLLVSNGVDRAFFERPAPAPATIGDLSEPRILYAGAVESWFDWQLVVRAARDRSAWNFVIVGRIQSPPPADLPSNVRFTGQQPYSDMPAFMQAASVGIIPFASRRHGEAIRAINPLKLYEYLAAGCPVVSSVRPLNLNCDGLFIYGTEDDFLEGVDKALELRKRMIKISAPQHVDWSEIVIAMLAELGLQPDNASKPLS
jgi:glycosyltransferase involved in cell wall biosynthesis